MNSLKLWSIGGILLKYSYNTTCYYILRIVQLYFTQYRSTLLRISIQYVTDLYFSKDKGMFINHLSIFLRHLVKLIANAIASYDRFK